MATMTIPSKAYGAPRKRAAAGPGLWTKFVDALKASRQAQAEAIVAEYAGSRWCDATEREINAKLIRCETHGLF